MSSSTSKALAIMPRQTMRGHTDWVTGVVHLPRARRIITCSRDGSLRLWDLESGVQIGEDWRDENNAEIRSMALSPNGKTVASGSGSESTDNNVRLWDIGTREVVTKWTGHTDAVCALCWSADGKRVASGSWDGTARVWDVNSSETVLTITTKHDRVRAVIYSPDNEKIATGGNKEETGGPPGAAKIWDSKTGKLITTLEHDSIVRSLAWTSDGKKLISGSLFLTRIFDTTTWEQIAILDGHANDVDFISLSSNNRLLASASSFEQTARLWNLDTNLPIGPPLQHEDDLESAALSADGKVLVTGCENGDVYSWDIHAIIKKAGLEDLLSAPAPKLLTTSDAMRARRPVIPARRIPPGFFDGAQSSAAHGTHHHSSTHDPRRPAFSLNPRTLFTGFSSLFRHSHHKTDEATELQQRPRRNIFSHRGPRIVDVPTVQDRKSLFVAPPPRPQQQSQSHGQTQASSSQTQPATASTSATPPVPGTAAQSPPIRWWARLVLFLCCVSLPYANGH